jgi:excisionase family DNA binding protein
MADDYNNPGPPHLPIALRTKQAAAALGISARHLWQLTEDGEIPCARLGAGGRKIKLYLLSELESWLKKATHCRNRDSAARHHPGSQASQYFSPDK